MIFLSKSRVLTERGHRQHHELGEYETTHSLYLFTDKFLFLFHYHLWFPSRNLCCTCLSNGDDSSIRVNRVTVKISRYKWKVFEWKDDRYSSIVYIKIKSITFTCCLKNKSIHLFRVYLELFKTRYTCWVQDGRSKFLLIDNLLDPVACCCRETYL